MTTLTRWEPFREIATLRNFMNSNAMNTLFDEGIGRSRLWPHQMDTFNLEMDVMEEGGNYVVEATVPGVEPDDIEITLTDNVLTIKGEAKSDNEVKDDSYHLRERRYGSFIRSLALPAGVNADEIEATNDKGILTVRVPKSEEIAPKKIPVTSVKA